MGVLLKTLGHLRRFYKAKPVLRMSRYGQLTPNPRVTLGLSSRKGSHGIFCENDNDSGNARIEMYGRSLSKMSGIPLRDDRK